MDKFCIGDKVVVVKTDDLYYGYYAKITGIHMTYDSVQRYEVRFIESNPEFPNECRIGFYPEYYLASTVSGYYKPRFVEDDVISYPHTCCIDYNEEKRIAQIMYYTFDQLYHRYIYTTTQGIKLYDTPNIKKLNIYSKSDRVCFKRFNGRLNAKFYGYIHRIRHDYEGNVIYDITSVDGDSYMDIPQNDIICKMSTSNDFAYDLTYAMTFKPGIVDYNGRVYSEDVVKKTMLKNYLNSHYGIAAIDRHREFPEIVLNAKFKFDREKMNKLAREYSMNDCLITKELIENMMKKNEVSVNMPAIKKVHFSGNVTVVIFEDDSKVIVKCQDGETFDPEKGLAMAIAKRALGTNKSGSNYYDIFKKWLPKTKNDVTKKIEANALKEEYFTEHEEDSLVENESILKDNRQLKIRKDMIKKIEERDSKKEDLSEISDKPFDEPEDANPCHSCNDRSKGCMTNCKKLQEYIDDIQEERKPEPIKPGYFIEHDEERKEKAKYVAGTPSKVSPKDPVPFPIRTFVDKFEATMFPQEFITFCRQHNLYFYVVDQIKGGLKKIDPYTVNWQQVTGLLKRGLMESCKKIKYHKNAGSSFLAVDMDKALFSMLPVELRGENRKEKKK